MERRVVLPALSRPRSRMEYSERVLLAKGKGAGRMAREDEGFQRN